jgi:hypothetical protein
MMKEIADGVVRPCNGDISDSWPPGFSRCGQRRGT